MQNQKIFYQMIPILKKIVNWFSNHIRVVTISIISLLAVTIFVQDHQLDKKNKELERLYNNIVAYEQLIDKQEDTNTALQLTINELNNSKDSLIQEANQIRKELNIKDKNLSQVEVINTIIRDTVTKVIPVVMNFKEELKINPLTTITVHRTDSILTAKLDITNQQLLIVEEKKVFKNHYKNGFIRFFHFDWKKIKVRKYSIVNSNPIIKITDSRVIEIK